jgi:hypothetical protein
MLQNIDEQVLRIRRIFGRPITNTLHVVPSEDRVDVITKASFESIHFALVDVIDAIRKRGAAIPRWIRGAC